MENKKDSQEKPTNDTQQTNKRKREEQEANDLLLAQILQEELDNEVRATEQDPPVSEIALAKSRREQ